MQWVLLGVVALCVSIYELMKRNDAKHFIASLAVRLATGSACYLGQLDPWIIATIFFCSPTTIVSLVRDAAQLVKGTLNDTSSSNDGNDSRRSSSRPISSTKARRGSE